MRRCSSRQTHSRPRRVPLTSPAPSMTFRCLVIACRETAVPAVSRVIDIGPSFDRRDTSPKRVSSPRAAKMGAEIVGSARARELPRIGKVLLNQLHYHAPTLLVCRERLQAALDWNLIKAGFSDGQQHSIRRVLQSEHDQCSWLG